MELKPIKDGRFYVGNQELLFAFQEARLDSLKFFFTYHFGPGQGNKATYYLDSKTLLPCVRPYRIDTNDHTPLSYDFPKEFEAAP
ncbi:MAG TPA: hypothetical protein VHU91_03580 [Mycobacteriales bacterium]|nr:hypothetical protein [Mycobacteriales bacterium]